MAITLPIPGAGPLTLVDVGANVSCRPEHLVQFAHMGSAFASAVLGNASPRVAFLSNGEEPSKGTPDLVEVHERLTGAARRGLNFIGNIEGTQVVQGVADVVVMDGFTGNITFKLIEGVSSQTMKAVRLAAMSSVRGKIGGLMLSPAVRRLRQEIDPEMAGGAYMLGLRSSGWWRTGAFPDSGSNARLKSPRGASRRTWSAHAEALGRAGALRPPGAPRTRLTRRGGGRWVGVRDSGYGVRLMTREQIFAVIRAHLADELEVDPDSIVESTRFREDLEADSLDLYTLVQELEDTYGVAISDEEAAEILTVGAAVEFVLASGVEGPHPSATANHDGE